MPAQQRVAAEQADHLVAVHDGKILLRRGQQEIGGVANGAAMRERAKFGHHGGADRDALRERPAARCRAFVGRAQIDEERDEGEHGHIDESVESHADGQHAAGPGSDARGLVLGFQARENGAQHAAAVHGERGEQIESGQDEIAQCDAIEQIVGRGLRQGEQIEGSGFANRGWRR